MTAPHFLLTRLGSSKRASLPRMLRSGELISALALALAACAADPKPASPAPQAPAPAPSAPALPPALGEPDAAPAASGEPATPVPSAETPTDAPPGVSPELVKAVDAYLTAANARDQSAQEAGATSECWQKECKSFAEQAGKKFRAERRSSLRRREQRAQVVVDIICDGSRKCDLVYLLFELDRTLRWVVADVTEDGKKADAWVVPAGYVEPKMPPNLPRKGKK